MKIRLHGTEDECRQMVDLLERVMLVRVYVEGIPRTPRCRFEPNDLVVGEIDPIVGLAAALATFPWIRARRDKRSDTRRGWLRCPLYPTRPEWQGTAALAATPASAAACGDRGVGLLRIPDIRS